MKRKLTILLALLFVGFVALGINDLRQGETQLKLNEIKLQDNLIELNKLKLEKEQLNTKFEQASEQDKVDAEKMRQLEQEKLQLEEKTRQLERDLQAKRDREANERTIANAQVQSKPRVAGAISGNKESWLRASGIPESDWWAVDSIVSRESGWNPCAYNPGRSDCNANPTTACGLAQSLPCGKQAKYGHWTDPVANLKWQHEYVTARYGGYPQAVAFWNKNHWY